MDESQDMFGDGSMVAELMPAAVLGSGTGALLFSSDTIRIPADVSIKKEGNDTTTKRLQKPVCKRPVGESKSASKKRARSESDVDKGDNLHPRPKMSYAQLAALALRASKKNEETVSGQHVFLRERSTFNLSLFVCLCRLCARTLAMMGPNHANAITYTRQFVLSAQPWGSCQRFAIRLHNRTCLGCTIGHVYFLILLPAPAPGRRRERNGKEKGSIQGTRPFRKHVYCTVLHRVIVGEDGVLLMRLSLSPFSLSRRSKKGWRNLQVDHGKLSVL